MSDERKMRPASAAAAITAHSHDSKEAKEENERYFNVTLKNEPIWPHANGHCNIHLPKNDYSSSSDVTRVSILTTAKMKSRSLIKAALSGSVKKQVGWWLVGTFSNQANYQTLPKQLLLRTNTHSCELVAVDR